jgi:fucose permease
LRKFVDHPEFLKHTFAVKTYKAIGEKAPSNLKLAAIIGGAAGPWVAGILHDLTGSYSLAF